MDPPGERHLVLPIAAGFLAVAWTYCARRVWGSDSVERVAAISWLLVASVNVLFVVRRVQGRKSPYLLAATIILNALCVTAVVALVVVFRVYVYGSALSHRRDDDRSAPGWSTPH
jgi:uncharacterized protein involved in response to NO